MISAGSSAAVSTAVKPVDSPVDSPAIVPSKAAIRQCPAVPAVSPASGPMTSIRSSAGKVREQRSDLAQTAGVGDQNSRAGIREPELQRLGAEQREQRHRDRAGLVGGQMGDSGFRRLRRQG